MKSLNEVTASFEIFVPSVLIYVIKPTVSPSISIPWYNLCAICIVLDAPNPNLLDEVCCKVEVVNGPDGFRVYVLEVISLILYFLFFINSTPELTSTLFLNENFSIFFPSSWLIFVFIIKLSFVKKFTFSVQNSLGWNTSISCSLSVSNLSATDWTLPADFDPGSFVHKIGDILKPTR